MKNIFVLGLILTLLSVAASAQTGVDRLKKQRIMQGIRQGQLTRGEVLELRKSYLRHKMIKQRGLRDGRLSPLEKRRILMYKKKERRDIFRKKHNLRRRLI